jgi:hypothetical protein
MKASYRVLGLTYFGGDELLYFVDNFVDGWQQCALQDRCCRHSYIGRCEPGYLDLEIVLE